MTHKEPRNDKTDIQNNDNCHLKGCWYIFHSKKVKFESVKKAGILIILLVYLISLTELNQLIKFPVLISHYLEHKEKKHDLSLIAYLKNHYSTQDDIQPMDFEDAKLPFKSHDGCANNLIVVYMPKQPENLNTKILNNCTDILFFFSEEYIPTHFSSAIWQPPKSC